MAFPTECAKRTPQGVFFKRRRDSRMAFPTEYAKGTPQGVFLFVMLFFLDFLLCSIKETCLKSH